MCSSCGQKRKSEPGQLSAALFVAFKPLLCAHLPMFLQVSGGGGHSIYLGLGKPRHKGLSDSKANSGQVGATT